jgi:hypothetical protein
MKRFFISTLVVTVFFLGLGALVERTGARLKSDDKALALIAKARAALGDDAAIGNIQSLVITGKTTRTFTIDGAKRSDEGDTEIALQLPDKFSKVVKMGKDDGSGEAMVDHQFDIRVMGDPNGLPMKIRVDAGDGPGEAKGMSKKIVIKKDDGTTEEYNGADADKFIAEHPGDGSEVQHKIVIKKEDGTTQELSGADAEKFIAAHHPDGDMKFKVDGGHVMLNRMGSEHGHGEHNELLRLTLSLLLTAPKGVDVSYTSAGESSVGGRPCDNVNAETGGQTFKICIDRSTSLPSAMTFTGMGMPSIARFEHKMPEPGDGSKEVVMFKRTAGPDDVAEIMVIFSDYRSVGGVQLPYHWEQSGGSNETFDVANYDVDPANIADKFQNQKMMVRMRKPDSQ